MKKLLLLLMVAPLFSLCQTDTIYHVNGEVIPCKITEVKQEYLRYNPQKGPDAAIDLRNVHSYVRKGKKNYILANSGLKKTIENNNTVNLTDDYAYLKMCLGEARKEYRTGVRVFFLGSISTCVGVLLLKSGDTKNVGNMVTFGGSVITLIGYGSMVNSNKWFGRAALGLNGNGATVTYRLK